MVSTKLLSKAVLQRRITSFADKPGLKHGVSWWYQLINNLHHHPLVVVIGICEQSKMILCSDYLGVVGCRRFQVFWIWSKIIIFFPRFLIYNIFMLGSCLSMSQEFKLWHLLFQVEKLSRSRLTEENQLFQDLPDLLGSVKAFSPPLHWSRELCRNPQERVENALLQKLLKCERLCKHFSSIPELNI